MKNNNYKEFDRHNNGYLSAIERNSLRLQDVVEKILDMAKLERMDLIPNKVSVEINNEIKDIVDEYRDTLQYIWNKEEHSEDSK